MYLLWLDPGRFLGYHKDQRPDTELSSLINHSPARYQREISELC